MANKKVITNEPAHKVLDETRLFEVTVDTERSFHLHIPKGTQGTDILAGVACMLKMLAAREKQKGNDFDIDSFLTGVSTWVKQLDANPAK